MPNWKKVIVSGSNASLNSITASNGAIITGSLSVTNTAFIDGQLTVDNNIRITGPAGSSLLLPDGGVVSDFNTGNTRIEFYSGSMQIYANGSNEISVLSTGVRIGNNITDSHRITGSLFVTNSFNVNGTQTIIPTPGSGPLFVGLIVSGSNTNGGSNYVDFLKPVNTAVGATNINKYYRLNSTGDIEIINSAYTSTIYSLSDTGNGYYAGGLGVGTAPPTTVGLIRASNDVVAFYSSDERLKDNKVKISNALGKLDKINGYEFDWIPKEGIHENEGHDIGVIAQEIEAILPEIVTTRDNGYKAVKYEKIVPLLIEAIKELKAEVDSLKSGNYNKWD